MFKTEHWVFVSDLFLAFGHLSLFRISNFLTIRAWIYPLIFPQSAERTEINGNCDNGSRYPMLSAFIDGVSPAVKAAGKELGHRHVQQTVLRHQRHLLFKIHRIAIRAAA